MVVLLRFIIVFFFFFKGCCEYEESCFDEGYVVCVVEVY